MKRLFILVVIAVACLSASAQSLLKHGRVPKDLKITLERTMCFGSCPDYRLTIDASGRIRFNGRHFTRVTGNASGRLTAAKVKALVKHFETAKFFKLKDSYEREAYCGGMVTDMPSENVEITISGRTKAVHHYFGCRGEGVRDEIERLSALAKYIDSSTRSSRWIEKR